MGGMSTPEVPIHNSTVIICPLSDDVRDPTCVRPFETKIFYLYFGTELVPVSSQITI